MALAACNGNTDSPPASAGPPQYVGSENCSSCHAVEHNDWQGSHHELAIQVADKSMVIGDFDDAVFDYFGNTTKFTTRGDDFIVTTQDSDGQEKEFTVAYTFGVTPLQQYLVEFPGGRMQSLPFAWDARDAADGGKRWFHLYGDEYIGPSDELHWTGRYQNWNYMCAECHSTNLAAGYDPGTDTFKTTYSELPVGCESCHGPGSEHLSQAQAAEFKPGFGLQLNLDERKSRSWIMNPETGIAERSVPMTKLPQEVETCGRCHSRRGPITELYEHGKSLSDTHLLALLDENLYFPDGQIQDEVYVYGSFVQSRMYRAGVSCSDCHNPHTASLRTGPEPSDVCAQCHLPSTFATPEHSGHASADATCVDCHMADRTYMGVDDRRDHSFRIPRPDLHDETGAPYACTNCHADKSADWASTALQTLGVTPRPHYGSVIAAGRNGRANDTLVRAAAKEDYPAIARATMLTLLAAPYGEDEVAALAKALGDSDPLLRIAALRTIRLLPSEVKLSLVGDTLNDPVRGVRLQSALAFADVQSLLPLEQARAFGRAAEEYREAYSMISSTPGALLNLGNFELASGNPSRAAAHFERALEIEPRHVPARLNLVDVLRRGQDQNRVEELLIEGVTLLPDNAAIRHSLGLALVRSGQTEAGVDELRRAAELEPLAPRYVYVLGIALNSVGQQAAAVELLETAFQEFPDHYDIGWALATVLRDSGDIRRALAVLDRLAVNYPDDSGIVELRNMLVQRLELQ